MATTYWCERLWTGERGRFGASTAGVLVTVEGGRIQTMSRDGSGPPPGTTPLAGLSMPALANAHSHAFHRVLRGRTQRDAGDFWTWRRLMYAAARALDPDTYHELATAVFAEMALAGYGAVGEFHYLHHDQDGRPYAEANAMGAALVAAAGRAGLRLTLLDTLYLRGGIGPGADAPLLDPDPVQRRFSDGTAEGWADRVSSLHRRFDADDVRIGAAIHSVRAVDPEAMTVATEWSATHGAPLHVHASEQQAENEQCRARYGCSPLALLADRGVLGPRTTVVHATHVDGGDLALLAEAGSGCCLCPTTERDLADGIGPAPELIGAGVPICLGTDSHAVIDPFEEARAVELDERLRSGHRGTTTAASLLTMAGRNGHRALGWPDGGVLVEGGPADLLTIGLDSVRTAGWQPDTLVETAVFAATAADVRHLLVGGRHVVRDGRHVTVDTASALDTAIRAVVDTAR